MVALVLKVRRSVPRAVGGRRWWRLGLGLLITIGAAAALAAGYLWVALGEIVWLDVAGLMRWTLLTVHAWIGLVLVPLVVIHLLPRRWRLLRPASGSIDRARSRLLTRRSVLVGGGLLVAAVGLRAAATPSSWSAVASAGSPARAGCPPVASRHRPRSSANPPRRSTLPAGACASAIGPSRLDELRALGETTRTAVLDCTSGWALETDWQGVPLATVLEAAGVPADRDVVVRSATGWATVVPRAEAADCLLAWGCAGADLPAGNGAPLRLVAPGHRGLDWVKWVAEIEPVRAG